MSKKVICVRFRTAGKVYYFSPEEFEIKKNDHVIVETARGVEYGIVVSNIKEIEESELAQPLKPVIRISTKEDDEMQKANAQLEKEALVICNEKIKARELKMKLIDAEYTFDRNKLLFYFTSDGRVDFRELVKDLASVFRTRIELRQIGVRDETKLMGGIGVCGRVLCCHTHLPDFAPVSIKMAKEQGLSLNPTKISGMCGRLMCCLKNEEDTYEELNRNLPGVGDEVTSENGEKGVVHSVNVLRQRVKVIIENGDDKEIKEYSVSELSFKRGLHRDNKEDISGMTAEELKELELLEKEEKEEAKESQDSKENRKDNKKDFKRDFKNKDASREKGENFSKDGNKDGNKESNKENHKDNRDRNNKKDFKNSKNQKDFKGKNGNLDNKDAKDNKNDRHKKGYRGGKPGNPDDRKNNGEARSNNNKPSDN